MKYNTAFRFPLSALAAALIILIGARFAPAQQWCPYGDCPEGIATVRPRGTEEWPTQATDPADYHAAVVRVIAGDGPVKAGGTGTLIAIDDDGKTGIVLTAAHVVGSNRLATATWAGGFSSSGSVLFAERGDDIAAFECAVPEGAVVLPLAESDQFPEARSTVELCGYGGGSKTLRHWAAAVQGYAQGATGRHHTLSVGTETISGDSGGPIVQQGRVVAVLWGGPLAGPRGPMTATHGTYCGRIRELFDARGILGRLGRLRPGRAAPPVQGEPDDGLVEVPPRETGPALEAEIAELEKRLDELAEARAEAGPPGPVGPTGPQGPPGEPGDDAAVDEPGLIGRLRERLGDVVTRDEVESTVGQRIAELPKSAASISTWTALAGALGLGGPIGLGVGVAGWLVSRRVKRKVGERLADASAPLSSVATQQALSEEPSPRLVERIVERVRDRVQQVPVRVDSPTHVERTVETHSVDVERDTYQRAHQWARQQMMRKFPGSVDLLETEQALIDQVVSGQTKLVP
jgi:hypothetical protein